MDSGKDSGKDSGTPPAEDDEAKEGEAAVGVRPAEEASLAWRAGSLRSRGAFSIST
jgi:hypothetical protein